MTIDTVTTNISNGCGCALEIQLLLIRQVLDTPIACIHPRFVWLSDGDVDITDCPIVLVMKPSGRFLETGKY